MTTQGKSENTVPKKALKQLPKCFLVPPRNIHSPNCSYLNVWWLYGYMYFPAACSPEGPWKIKNMSTPGCNPSSGRRTERLSGDNDRFPTRDSGRFNPEFGQDMNDQVVHWRMEILNVKILIKKMAAGWFQHATLLGSICRWPGLHGTSGRLRLHGWRRQGLGLAEGGPPAESWNR